MELITTNLQSNHYHHQGVLVLNEA